MAESRLEVAIRVAHAAMVPLFALCVAVQYNDPDPVRWIAIYTAALVVAALGAAGRPNAWVAGVIGLVALVWAATGVGPFVACLAPGRTCFSSWDMHDDLVAEVARETGGLLIVTACCVVAIADARWRLRGQANGRS